MQSAPKFSADVFMQKCQRKKPLRKLEKLKCQHLKNRGISNTSLAPEQQLISPYKAEVLHFEELCSVTEDIFLSGRVSVLTPIPQKLCTGICSYNLIPILIWAFNRTPHQLLNRTSTDEHFAWNCTSNTTPLLHLSCSQLLKPQ